MEVILLADVKNVGRKNQTVTVSDGYANNFLFKKHLAVPVSKKSVEILETQQENARIAEENKKKDAEKLVETLKGVTVEFEAKVGKDSKLFGSISLKQVEAPAGIESTITGTCERRSTLSNSRQSKAT